METKPKTTGRLLRRAWWYDVTAWLMTGGRECVFRERLMRLAPLSPQGSVLDVGCGTGSLALAIKRRMGSACEVIGIDASAEMIERARRKAGKARLNVAFQESIAEALPFADASFDVVFSTLMLHHMPSKARARCLDEIARVLKPGGSVLIADFETSENAAHGPLTLVHRRRHGHVKREALADAISIAGMRIVESGVFGVGTIHYARAEHDPVRARSDIRFR